MPFLFVSRKERLSVRLKTKLELCKDVGILNSSFDLMKSFKTLCLNFVIRKMKKVRESHQRTT